jgi:pimeloyl-ACP methyl ester carboxylesterase
MTPLAWEHWVERYEAHGFTVLTPGYPGIGQGEAGLQALRDNPDAVAGVGVREVMDYMTDYVTKLDTAPIIMGHSFGGTFAQLLVGNGLGSAGVSIDGAAVKGINAMPISEVRSVLPVLDNPANINKASILTPKQFHYAFTNAQDEQVSKLAKICQGGSPYAEQEHFRQLVGALIDVQRENQQKSGAPVLYS